MAPGPSPEAYDREARASLLYVARASVAHGLENGTPLRVDPADYPEVLRERRASFVTLRRHGALRGCTGRLAPEHPLTLDVALNAFQSAFGDPRFESLRREEFADLELHISILSPLEPLAAASEAALLEQLRPGVDGLLLREGTAVATFLPDVWDALASPGEFLHELRRKAGLPRGYWSSTLRFERYCTVQIRE
ncbi:MAG: AmmeMemoRadiSam system protein A [Myxococcales bacterium]|nr:AmmeMemoRadiSam system protein A [Myxococcales bacterium]MDH5306440.1 AmmeMemoRadiSam system protein A [Myxococcales bacterium]MDH5567390.1 AmmeMemoRadiSam system protein A [Myxococcales bacterium]